MGKIFALGSHWQWDLAPSAYAAGEV